MSKQTIEWHERCLKNMKSYMEHLSDEIQRLDIKLLKSMEEYETYNGQIEQAKKLGKKSFDRDRFGRLKK